MSIKKNMLLASFLLLASAQVLAAPAHKKRSVSSTGSIKFGPQVEGIGAVKVFGEYKFSETLAIQAALAYVQNTYWLDSVQESTHIGEGALVKASYINLPIALRAYPG